MERQRRKDFLKESSVAQKVLVLGAGISGLTFAYYLKKRFASNVSVRILEASERVGGLIRTNRNFSSCLEEGPRGCRPKGKGLATLRLIEDLGITDQMIVADESAKKRFLFYENSLEALPQSLKEAISSPLMKGVAKELICEPLRRRGKDSDETIASFFKRRFGPTITKRFIAAVSRGIYAGDIEQLSMRSCFPQILNLEKSYGSLIWGMFRSPKEKTTDLSSFIKKHKNAALISFKEGMETLPQELLKQTDLDLSLKAKVEAIEFHGSTVIAKTKDSTWEADHLVSTIPTYQLESILPKKVSSFFVKIKAMPWTTVIGISLVYKKAVLPQKGFGYLVPEGENSALMGVVWDSSVFPEQNIYPDETRLTIMMGGEHRPDLLEKTDKELTQLAFHELNQQMGIKESADYVHLWKARHAIPQYNLGHSDEVKQLSEKIRSSLPQLHLIGMSYHGVAVNDCIFHAKDLVNQWNL